MILLQIGQCGIQVGQSLVNCMQNENPSKDALEWPLNLVDQLVIDTERKVWTKQSRKSKSIFPVNYLDQGTVGRGNNWAFGFFDDQGLEGIMDRYRRMTERLCKYDGAMLIHSLAGGTGSGLGSRLALEIRQEYGKGSLMTSSFAPFTSGETVVQNYNSLLSLAILEDNADFIGYFPNDSLLNVASRIQTTSTHSNKQCVVNMDAMNQYAACCLAGQLIPVTRILNNGKKFQISDAPIHFDPNDFVYSLSPSPDYKFGMFSSSRAVLDNSQMKLDSWDDTMTSMIRNNPLINLEFPRCNASSKLIFRGVQGPEVWKRLPSLIKRWDQRIGPSMLEATIDLSYTYEGLHINDKKKSVESCFNSDAIIPHISPILDKAKKLYDHKAYLHWYTKYAKQDTEELFESAFERMFGVVDRYTLLKAG